MLDGLRARQYSDLNVTRAGCFAQERGHFQLLTVI